MIVPFVYLSLFVLECASAAAVTSEHQIKFSMGSCSNKAANASPTKRIRRPVPHIMNSALVPVTKVVEAENVRVLDSSEETDETDDLQISSINKRLKHRLKAKRDESPVTAFALNDYDAKRKRKNDFVGAMNMEKADFCGISDIDSFVSPFAPVTLEDCEGDDEKAEERKLIWAERVDEDEVIEKLPFIQLARSQSDFDDSDFEYMSGLKRGHKRRSDEVFEEYNLDDAETETKLDGSESESEGEQVEFFKLANEERGTTNSLVSPSGSLATAFSPQNFRNLTPSCRLTPLPIRVSPLGLMTRSTPSVNLAAMSPTFKESGEEVKESMATVDDEEDYGLLNGDDDGSYDSELEKAFEGFGFYIDEQGKPVDQEDLDK